MNGSASNDFDVQALTGFTCGSLLPTGQARDLIDGVWVTCIDLGEPHVLVCGNAVKGDQTGISSTEASLERLRLQAGYLMGMGNRAGQHTPRLLQLYSVGTTDTVPVIKALPQAAQRQPMASAGSAAALALACSLADTVAHECCPLPPLPAAVPSHAKVAVPDWILTVVGPEVSASMLRPSAITVQLVRVVPHCVLRTTAT